MNGLVPRPLRPWMRQSGRLLEVRSDAVGEIGAVQISPHDPLAINQQHPGDAVGVRGPTPQVAALLVGRHEHERPIDVPLIINPHRVRHVPVKADRDNLQPTGVVLLVDLLDGILLPVIAIFLLIVLNRSDLLGRYKNGVVANLLGAAVVLIVTGLGAYKFLTVFGLLA